MITFTDLNGMDSGAIAVTAVLLFLFGLAFNQVVTYLHRKGINEGFTWLEVVVGVAVVIIAAGFTLGWGATILLFIYMAAAGVWMAAGDIWRGIRAKQAEMKERQGE